MGRQASNWSSQAARAVQVSALTAGSKGSVHASPPSVTVMPFVSSHAEKSSPIAVISPVVLSLPSVLPNASHESYCEWNDAY